MARKEDNLVKGDEAHKFTPEEASKGGKASAEARRRKRDLRKAFEALLEKDFLDKKGTSLTGAEILALKQFDKAMKGDTRAFEVVRDTAGQKPVEKIQVEDVDQEALEELERMVLEDD